MAQAIVYCDLCSRIVLPSEMTVGQAIVTQDHAVCASCAESLTPEQRASIQEGRGSAVSRREAGSSAAGRTAQESSSPRTSTERRRVRPNGPYGTQAAQSAKPRMRIALAVSGAGALLGVAVAALLSVRSPEPVGHPLSAAPTVEASPIVPNAPTAPSSGVGSQPAQAEGREELSPASKRLDQPRATIDASLARYDEIREEREALGKGSETEKARRDDRWPQGPGDRPSPSSVSKIRRKGESAEKAGIEVKVSDNERHSIDVVEGRAILLESKPADINIGSIASGGKPFASSHSGNRGWGHVGNLNRSEGIWVPNWKEDDPRGRVYFGIDLPDPCLVDKVGIHQRPIGAAFKGIRLTFSEGEPVTIELPLDAEEGKPSWEWKGKPHYFMFSPRRTNFVKAEVLSYHNPRGSRNNNGPGIFRLEIYPAKDADEMSRPSSAHVESERASRTQVGGAAEVDDGLPRGPKEPLPGETGLPGQWAPGLIAEIFEGKGYGRRVAVRIDPYVDFNFGKAPPDPNSSADRFTIRWTGWLLIPSEGKYTFEVQGDDHLGVSLDGRPLAEASYFSEHRSKPRRYTVGLYPISATLSDGGDRAAAHLRWQRPGGGDIEGIGREFFFHRVPELGEKGPFAKVCQGLHVEYYAGENLNRKLVESTRDHVNFDIGELPFCGARAGALPKDHFSVRMKGYLLARADGRYRFEIDVDDGARLRIDGATVAEHWGSKSKGKLTGEINLSAGLREFVLDYMEETAKAKLKMKWHPPGQEDHLQDMPSNVLFHEPPKRVTVDRKGLAPGIAGRMFRGEKPDPRNAILETLDPSACFNWGKRKPGEDVPKNKFSAAWNGSLVVPMAGMYLFRVRHYGGVRLVIGRRPIINKWKPNDGWQEAAIALRAGSVSFDLAYFNRQRRAGVEVYWAGPSFGFRRLGPEALAHKADELPMGKVIEGPAEPTDVAGVPSKGGAVAKGPGAATWTAPEKLPEGNQVKNGGFEERDDQTKFAKFWRPHQWGEPGAQYSVRIDHTEPHSGKAAVVVKAFEDGARRQGVSAEVWTGVYTTLTLAAGKYELRYWACADADESARVGGHLAGQDLAQKTVGDGWQQFKETVELPDRQAGASLKLWTTTGGVRVWFDDVEVKGVR